MTGHAAALAVTVVLSIVGTSAERGAEPEAPAPPARELTLAQCVELALRRNPEAASAAAEVAATEAARSSARGGFGPKVRAEANVVRWDGAFETGIGAAGTPLPIPPVQVRDATTTAASLSLIQPLTSLWTVYESYRIRDLGVGAARSQGEAVRRNVTYRATEAYYRLLQARRLEEIARKSVEQVQAQVDKARSFFEQGVVRKNDVLRADLGLATARQRLIQARGNAALAQGRLAIVTGLPPDTVITPSDVQGGQEPLQSVAVEGLERRALETRAELREAAFRADQAGGEVRAAWSRMLPQINAVASYQRNTGSKFQPENAYFVGLFATWDVWEWGATYYGTVEARARRDQALDREAKARDDVLLEVRAASVEYRAAAEALEVARAAVVQAEENFRLESRRYEARTSTSFDVLDAETLLAQARTQEQNAVYDHLIARADLDRAAGSLPYGNGGSRG